MDPMVALAIAFSAFYLFVRSAAVKTPSRFVLASPTTVWPLASLGAGVGLAAAAVIVLRSIGAGGIAILVAVAIVLGVTTVGKSTTQPKRLVYERGGTVILRSHLILAFVGGGVILYLLTNVS